MIFTWTPFIYYCTCHCTGTFPHCYVASFSIKTCFYEATFYISRNKHSHTKIKTVSENLLKINVILRWKFFRILHMSSVICKQKLLHENEVLQYLYNYRYYVDKRHVRKSLQSSTKSIKIIYPNIACTFFTGHSIFGYFQRLNCYNCSIYTAWKCIRIRSYSGPYFPTFGLNTERYSVSLRIQSEYGKIRTKVTPNWDTFYAIIVALFLHLSLSEQAKDHVLMITQ